MTKTSKYIDIFLTPIQKCKAYQPKFGTRRGGVSVEDFLALYGADPFYSAIGLDNELMYAAHKAAGGMTSIYRQIGVGCEHLFRQILIDTAQYTDEKFADWSYTTKTSGGKEKVLSLDGRLELSEINNPKLSKQLTVWISDYCSEIGATQTPQKGVVFEVRQGYKSKDSKRQNADIDNATVAWASGYLPVFAIFSSQIDEDIVLRYRNSRCGVLVGADSKDPKVSLFAFSREVLGFDLAEFFTANSATFKKEIHAVLKTLLYAG